MARVPKAILLPGLDGSGRLFAPLLAAAPRAFEAIPVSFPPDRPLGYDELAALVRPQLPRGRFVLLAESFSGPLAVRLAAERPPGLAALILAATFLHRPLDALLHPVRGLVGAHFFGFPMPAPMVRHFMAGPDAPDALVGEVQRAVAAVRAEVLAHRSAEALKVDAREALARVEVPILFLAPTRDRLIRRDAHDDVLAIRPDAEVAHVEAPHMVLQRCPHASLARMEEFLPRTRASAPRTRAFGRESERLSPARAHPPDPTPPRAPFASTERQSPRRSRGPLHPPPSSPAISPRAPSRSPSPSASQAVTASGSRPGRSSTSRRR